MHVCFITVFLLLTVMLLFPFVQEFLLKGTITVTLTLILYYFLQILKLLMQNDEANQTKNADMHQLSKIYCEMSIVTYLWGLTVT